jgi:hypothetical protein
MVSWKLCSIYVVSACDFSLEQPLHKSRSTCTAYGSRLKGHLYRWTDMKKIMCYKSKHKESILEVEHKLITPSIWLLPIFLY